MASKSLVACLVLLATATDLPAQDDPGAALAQALRPVLLEAVPAVLYEKADDWGRQKPVANGAAAANGQLIVRRGLVRRRAVVVAGAATPLTTPKGENGAGRRSAGRSSCLPKPTKRPTRAAFNG